MHKSGRSRSIHEGGTSKRIESGLERTRFGGRSDHGEIYREEQFDQEGQPPAAMQRSTRVVIKGCLSGEAVVPSMEN